MSKYLSSGNMLLNFNCVLQGGMTQTGSGAGGVSQLQQRLTANRMPQGGPGGMMAGQPNMTQGQRMAGMSGVRVIHTFD